MGLNFKIGKKKDKKDEKEDEDEDVVEEVVEDEEVLTTDIEVDEGDVVEVEEEDIITVDRDGDDVELDGLDFDFPDVEDVDVPDEVVDFVNDMDDDKKKMYIKLMMTHGEGELRDSVIRETGLYNDVGFIVDVFKSVLSQLSKEKKLDGLKIGKSYDERVGEAVKENEDLFKVGDVAPDIEDDLDEGEEEDVVSELLDVLRDCGTLPKMSVKSKLNKGELERFKSLDNVSEEALSYRWVD